MKIALISLVYGRAIGVEKKITDVAAAAASLGLNFDFYVLNRGKTYTAGSVNFIKIKERIFPLNLTDYMFRRYDLIKEAIDVKSYDYIILRYPLADHSGKKFFNEFKVITEHHSDEIHELVSKIKTKSWLRSKDIFQKIIHLISLHLEKKYGSKILTKAQGIISVTNEIRDCELEKSGQKPAFVMTNGVSVDNTPLTRFVPFDGKTLKMIFVAARFLPWQGLDRLLKSVELYSGPSIIHLFIVGRVADTGDLTAARNIRNPRIKIELLGERMGAELDYYFGQSNIAVGPLALFRKNMTEACPLKVREYIARGIPLIYAYDDPDIPLNFEFTKRFSNDDRIISIEEIITFIQKLSSLKDVSEKMRKFAIDNLDWKIKLGTFNDFIKNLAKADGERLK